MSTRVRRKYKRGSLFTESGDFYILARVSEHYHCQMIAMKDGNIWHEGVYVKDCNNITEAEIEKMAGSHGKFEFYCDPIDISIGSITNELSKAK